ncbi:hypothetical protein [Piscinibacter sp. XHJ-5]|uniref:hypothetical protein n=1 Tax=Piscinibacter sp. XHJ-5 TaxID=3037797 RepID=UPI002452D7E5|nr:hypothetical protein [Piscinibacter sp. XHJ-5]
MAYEARYVFRPTAGADLEAVVSAMKQCAAIWQKHGAPKPRLWAVAAGELGNYALTIEFKNAAAYAEAADPLSADPEFRRWQADTMRAGAVYWVRSNLMREIDLA